MIRHALITGTAGGIGAALAAHFLRAGWQVTGIDLAPPTIDAAGYRHVRCDITDEPALAGAFDEAEARAPISAAIANAAVTDIEHQPAVALDYARWRQVLRVNVDGSFLTARLAARHMRSGGNIVFVTSSLAFFSQARANDGPYCASKSAIEMLMRVMAIELADKGINVNTVFPSVMIESGFFAHLPAEERARLARPSILDQTTLFLASLPAGALTGISLDQQRWDTDESYRRQLMEQVA